MTFPANTDFDCTSPRPLLGSAAQFMQKAAYQNWESIMKRTLLSIGIGAGIMYLLDPELGAVRRSYLRDKLRGVAPKTSEAIHEKKEALAATAHDLTAKADAAAAEKIDSIPVETAEVAEAAEDKREASEELDPAA
jgi:hypothetical protein